MFQLLHINIHQLNLFLCKARQRLSITIIIKGRGHEFLSLKYFLKTLRKDNFANKCNWSVLMEEEQNMALPFYPAKPTTKLLVAADWESNLECITKPRSFAHPILQILGNKVHYLFKNKDYTKWKIFNSVQNTNRGKDQEFYGSNEC